MSKKQKEPAQLDRIEAKLDELLAFRDSVNQRIEGLLGKSDSMLSGPVMATLGGLLRNGSKGGASKSG